MRTTLLASALLLLASGAAAAALAPAPSPERPARVEDTGSDVTMLLRVEDTSAVLVIIREDSP